VLKEYVLNLKEKLTQHWCPYCQIANTHKQYFMTYPLNITFDDLDI